MKKTSEWHSTQNQEYLELVENRLSTGELVWTGQVAGVLQEFFPKGGG